MRPDPQRSTLGHVGKYTWQRDQEAKATTGLASFV